MDRRAKKLERKRKSREQAKQKATALAARRPSRLALIVRAAAREDFGPCFVSASWDDLASPALVSVLVTRLLPDGQLVPSTALVDRTCVGVKDAFVMEPLLSGEVADLVDRMGLAHDGMLPCEPLVAQSIVFHAIDHARSLGFEPHRDFQAALFGPRPSTLLDTPWSAPDRPIYVRGPHDDARAIMNRLTKAVGADGFEYVDPLAYEDDMHQDDDVDDDELVHSPLERTVSGDGVTLSIFIYRGPADAVWRLEVEDHLGGSTVWDEKFETDRAALDAALNAVELDGFQSFLVSPATDTSLRSRGQ